MLKVARTNVRLPKLYVFNLVVVEDAYPVIRSLSDRPAGHVPATAMEAVKQFIMETESLLLVAALAEDQRRAF